MMELPERLTTNPDVIFEELDGLVVLAHLDNEKYFTLDTVGSRVWSHLADGKDTRQIIELLLAEFDVDEPTLYRDLEKLISDLLAAGLVRA